jgi:methyl-accepting chemotaxis protein
LHHRCGYARADHYSLGEQTHAENHANEPTTFIRPEALSSRGESSAMKGVPHISIHQKLTRIVFFTCGAGILLACSAFMTYDGSASMTALESEMTTVATILDANMTSALEFHDADAAVDILESLRSQEHVVRACVYDRDGKIFAKYARPGTDANFIPPEPRSDYSGRRGLGRFAVFHSIRLTGQTVGTIYIEYDAGELRVRLVSFIFVSISAIAISLVTALMLASRFQRSISEPILDLAKTAFAVSLANDYSVRVNKESNDEIGFLVDRFNDMMGRVQERETALQQARNELETRVEERTRELKNEMTEREQAEDALEEKATS